MMFQTARTHCYRLEQGHANDLHRYYTDNAEHLAPWEPRRAPSYHARPAWEQRLEQFLEEQRQGSALRVLAFEPNTDQLIGLCAFTNIVQGVFQACNLGYSIAHDFGGQGLMTEIVGAAVDAVFEDLDLHRVMANYMPENVRSARVLNKLGFQEEGLARSYLRINGAWRDHILTSKLNPAHISAS